MFTFQSRNAGGLQTWFAPAAAGMAATLFFCALAYWHVGFQDDRRTKARKAFVPVATRLTGRASKKSISAAAGKLTSATPVAKEFFRDAERLTDAADNFRGEKPEDVIARVHRENAARGINVYPFEWDATGAMLFFSGENGPVELDDAMGRCAEAVEETIAPR